MLKVSGFQKTDNGLFSKDPIIKTTIHLNPMGRISVDLHFLDQKTNTQVLFQSVSGVKREDLTYNTEIIDPYDSLINAVEDWLIKNFFDESVEVEIVQIV